MVFRGPTRLVSDSSRSFTTPPDGAQSRKIFQQTTALVLVFVFAVFFVFVFFYCPFMARRWIPNLSSSWSVFF